MKKDLFNLQMFADDNADTNTDNQQNNGTDTAGNNSQSNQSQPDNQADKKYTDKDVDDLISKKFAEWQKKKDKELDEAKKLADMNAQQKAEYERDKLQKQLDEYLKKDKVSEMTKAARKILLDDGITVSDDLLSLMVAEDAETTNNAIASFSKLFKAAVEDAVKERLKGNSPKGSSGGIKAMTKEEIMAIKDPELRQQKMLENRHLFNF